MSEPALGSGGGAPGVKGAAVVGTAGKRTHKSVGAVDGLLVGGGSGSGGVGAARPPAAVASPVTVVMSGDATREQRFLELRQRAEDMKAHSEAIKAKQRREAGLVDSNDNDRNGDGDVVALDRSSEAAGARVGNRSAEPPLPTPAVQSPVSVKTAAGPSPVGVSSPTAGAPHSGIPDGDDAGSRGGPEGSPSKADASTGSPSATGPAVAVPTASTAWNSDGVGVRSPGSTTSGSSGHEGWGNQTAGSGPGTNGQDVTLAGADVAASVAPAEQAGLGLNSLVTEDRDRKSRQPGGPPPRASEVPVATTVQSGLSVAAARAAQGSGAANQQRQGRARDRVVQEVVRDRSSSRGSDGGIAAEGWVVDAHDDDTAGFGLDS